MAQGSARDYKVARAPPACCWAAARSLLLLLVAGSCFVDVADAGLGQEITAGARDLLAQANDSDDPRRRLQQPQGGQQGGATGGSQGNQAVASPSPCPRGWICYPKSGSSAAPLLWEPPCHQAAAGSCSAKDYKTSVRMVFNSKRATNYQVQFTSFTGLKATSPSSGGGIYAEATELIVDHCLFEKCESRQYGSGGAISLKSGDYKDSSGNKKYERAVTAQISHTMFRENKALWSRGGAIHMLNGGSLSVKSCAFVRNEATSSGSGGAICVRALGYNSAARLDRWPVALAIDGSTFVENVAPSMADHVYTEEMSMVKIYNVSFAPFTSGGSKSVQIAGTMAGCETHKCSKGFGCSYSNYSLSCSACPAGTVSKDGILCSLCRPGEQPNSAQTDCEKCPPKTYSKMGTKCQVCLAHTDEKRTTCTRCPPGHGPRVNCTYTLLPLAKCSELAACTPPMVKDTAKYHTNCAGLSCTAAADTTTCCKLPPSGGTFYDGEACAGTTTAVIASEVKPKVSTLDACVASCRSNNGCAAAVWVADGTHCYLFNTCVRKPWHQRGWVIVTRGLKPQTMWQKAKALPPAKVSCKRSVSCTFDSGLCNGWTESGKKHWTVGARTPSSSTGAVKSFSGANMIFLETSAPSKTGDVSYVVSPQFSGVPGSKSVSFYYHMHGATMGSLSLEQLVGSSPGTWKVAWSKTGQQQPLQSSQWQHAVMQLSNFSSQVRLKGTRGSSHTGDMSVDSMVICLPPAPPVFRKDCKTTCTLCKWANFSIDGRCLECPWPSVVNVHKTTCTQCTAGKGPNADRSACDECPKRQYSAFGFCQDCPAPNVVMNNGSSCGSSQCTAGTTCAQALCSTAAECVQCPPGSVSLGGACEDCAGKGPEKVANQLQSACISCSPGTQPHVDRISCVKCQGANYSKYGIKCESSPLGYQPNRQRTDFVDINECNSSKLNNCDPLRGRQQNVPRCANTPGSYTCADCPDGFVDGSGKAARHKCVPRKVTSAGASSIQPATTLELNAEPAVLTPGSKARAKLQRALITDLVSALGGNVSDFSITSMQQVTSAGRRRLPTTAQVSVRVKIVLRGTDASSTLLALTTQLADPTSKLMTGAATGKFLPNQVPSIESSCPAGKQISSDNTQCERCAKGKHSAAGDDPCQVCKAGTMASNDRSSCVGCPDHTFNTNGIDCMACKDGYTSSVARTQCVRCPAPQFQGANNFLIAPRCPGTTRSAGQQCKTTFVGVLCQSCNASYYMDRSGECQQCETRTFAERLPGIGLVLVVLCLVLRALTHDASNDDDDDEDLKSTVQISTVDLIVRCAFQPTRILITYVQVTAQLGGVLQIRFPESFEQKVKEVGSFVDVFSLFFSPECNGVGDFADKWLMSVVVLPATMTLMAMLYFFLEHGKPAARDNFVGNLLFIIFFCFPSIVNTCFNAFNCVEVIDPASPQYAGRAVLLADDRVDCNDLGLLQSVSGLVIAVFGCGVPIVFAVVLILKSHTYDRTLQGTNAAAVAKRAAEKFHVSTTQAEYIYRDIAIGSKYSFLMDAYKPSCLWWESLDILRKLSLVGAVVFMGQGSVEQIVCAAALSFIFFSLHVKLWPYKLDADNRLRALTEVQVFITILAAMLLRVDRAADCEDEQDNNCRLPNSTLDMLLVASLVLCVAVPYVVSVFVKYRLAQQSVLGTDIKSVFDRFALGLANEEDRIRLEKLFAMYAESLAGGREGSNLSFDGNIVFSQKFFIASFPGIYEGSWKSMTAGEYEGLLCCACVFFQDGSPICGQHSDVDLDGIADDVDGDQACHCQFLADAAPDQNRTGWDGVKAPWGCMWFSMWVHHVRALAECGQQAVVIRQSSKPVYDEVKKCEVKGKEAGLGNAQQGEVKYLLELGIPVYEYDITEYEQLVDLALRNQPVPKERLLSGVHPVAAARSLWDLDAATNEDVFDNPVVETETFEADESTT